MGDDTVEVEKDEHAIWLSRWNGKKVSTPDGVGVCCGFNNEGPSVEYQVRLENEHGVTTWRHYNKKFLKLIKRSGL
jgi:hypothetical protein